MNVSPTQKKKKKKKEHPNRSASQANKQSSTWVFALDMTCQQLVIKLSQASIRQSRQRPDTGQHAACLFFFFWEGEIFIT